MIIKIHLLLLRFDKENFLKLFSPPLYFFMSLFYRRLWSRQLQRLQIDSAQLALGMLNYQLNESSHSSMALFHRSANQKFGRDSYSIQQ